MKGCLPFTLVKHKRLELRVKVINWYILGRQLDCGDLYVPREVQDQSSRKA